MKTITHDVEKTVDHPMEEIFDIESNTTIITQEERVTDLEICEDYDNKDTEIETQFQDVYDTAITAFENQMDEVELVEGKYKARTSEIAVQFLNTALSAVKEKSQMKQSKDKTTTANRKIKNTRVTNNNLVIADRNELLKQLFRDKD